jgi:Domain of unknown function (DUF4279)
MAQVQRSVVSLRIASEDLDPNKITRLLGATPTHTQIKGEKIVGKKTGYVRIAKFGMWQLSASDCEPEDMDGQIREILSQTTSDLAVWRSITQEHEIDLFCGLFLSVSNEGMTLSPESLAALGERGIELGLDIYSGFDEDEPRT